MPVSRVAFRGSCFPASGCRPGREDSSPIAPSVHSSSVIESIPSMPSACHTGARLAVIVIALPRGCGQGAGAKLPVPHRVGRRVIRSPAPEAVSRREAPQDFRQRQSALSWGTSPSGASRASAPSATWELQHHSSPGCPRARSAFGAANTPVGGRYCESQQRFLCDRPSARIQPPGSGSFDSGKYS